ncbi:HpcH/HpaI aldolase/citrate lyase family protein [Roseibium sp.]|uniref:HpcH/HpaI aldolase/citrate lyase family protein n=1 Tax=Roseibium sp. TaxID=1936156 RepID=UPI003D0C4F2D
MPMPPHMVRSWLFVPASDRRKMAKALEAAADVVILDLEDSVSSDSKAEARMRVAEALQADTGSARYVRVNGLETGLTEEDVAATTAMSPDGYVLPKCEGPEDIERLASMIRTHAPKNTPGILAICTETVRAVRNLMRLDWSHPWLTGLTWGGEDLQAELGAFSNRGTDGRYLSPFSMARDLALFAAKDAGIFAIDSVFTDIRNPEELGREALVARTMGFDGKMLIHPAQIDAVHRHFAPSKAELDWASRVVDTLEKAGGGVAQLDGKMLDRPHLKLAEKILRQVHE